MFQLTRVRDAGRVPTDFARRSCPEIDRRRSTADHIVGLTNGEPVMPISVSLPDSPLALARDLRSRPRSRPRSPRRGRAARGAPSRRDAASDPAIYIDLHIQVYSSSGVCLAMARARGKALNVFPQAPTGARIPQVATGAAPVGPP